MSGAELRTLIGHALTVHLPGDAARHQFILESAVGSVAVLRPIDAEGKAFCGSLTQGQALQLGAALPHGYLATGVVVDRWIPGQRMLMVTNPAEVEVLQRRQEFRVPVKLGVELAVIRDSAVRTVTGETVNVSAGGMAAIASARMELGEIVGVLMRCPPRPVLFTAEVLFVGEPGRSAARFCIDRIAPTDFSLLASVLRRAEVTLTRTK
ncbi:MAG: PilZ domain-containing protein [Acidimicrobiia bacterium]